MTISVTCPFCRVTREVEANPEDRALAISVMDHRTKFQGSSILMMWHQRYGDAKPEEVFPELEGYDVDAHFAALQKRRREIHGDRVPE